MEVLAVKKLMMLLIAMMLSVPALADQYVYSKPANNQIQKEQAIQIGAEFFGSDLWY